jgi:hypothetical protein
MELLLLYITSILTTNYTWCDRTNSIIGDDNCVAIKDISIHSFVQSSKHFRSLRRAIIPHKTFEYETWQASSLAVSALGLHGQCMLKFARKSFKPFFTKHLDVLRNLANCCVATIQCDKEVERNGL